MFLREIFCEEFFGRTSWFTLVCQDFGFCQDFVSVQGRRKANESQSLEVQEASSSHLNLSIFIRVEPTIFR